MDPLSRKNVGNPIFQDVLRWVKFLREICFVFTGILPLSHGHAVCSQLADNTTYPRQMYFVKTNNSYRKSLRHNTACPCVARKLTICCFHCFFFTNFIFYKNILSPSKIVFYHFEGQSNFCSNSLVKQFENH